MKVQLRVLLISVTSLALISCAFHPLMERELREVSHLVDPWKSMSSIHQDLINFPKPRGPIPISVFSFRDQTGQYKPPPSSSFSTAVTQGATAMVMSALHDSGWFVALEREGLQDLLTERKIIRAARGEDKVRPLFGANLMIDGGIIAYDTNIKTGGDGAKYFGIGLSEQYRVDVMTINLRLVETQTSKVVHSINVSKTILSREVSTGVFRFVKFKRLLELESGFTQNDPTQMILRDAIDTAVMRLIVAGIAKRNWSLKDPNDMRHDLIQDYATPELMVELLSLEEKIKLEQSTLKTRPREALNPKAQGTAKAPPPVRRQGPPPVRRSQTAMQTNGATPAPATQQTSGQRRKAPGVTTVNVNNIPQNTQAQTAPRAVNTVPAVDVRQPLSAQGQPAQNRPVQGPQGGQAQARNTVPTGTVTPNRNQAPRTTAPQGTNPAVTTRASQAVANPQQRSASAPTQPSAQRAAKPQNPGTPQQSRQTPKPTAQRAPASTQNTPQSTMTMGAAAKGAAAQSSQTAGGGNQVTIRRITTTTKPNTQAPSAESLANNENYEPKIEKPPVNTDPMYIIQLATSNDMGFMKSLLSEWKPIMPNVKLVLSSSDKKGWYALVWGEFTTYEQASAVLRELPSTVKSQEPWVRQQWNW